MSDGFYFTPAWRELRERVLERDGSACVLGRFVGGACSGPLHVHHIVPRRERPDLELVEENCVTACEGHHPVLEAFRRLVARVGRPLPPCRHAHPYPAGRLECARRRARAAGLALTDEQLAQVA